MSFWPAILAIVYSLALVGLSLYGLNQATLCAIFWRLRPRQVTVEPRQEGLEPFVTIQLALYNELNVAERVIRSACEVDYPPHLLEIQVLDDSTDQTLELTRRLVDSYRSRGVSITHIHRDDRRGFKAGALANGLARARGELIAVFDADFVVPPDFLRRIVPLFADPTVGIVQTRWAYLNDASSELTRAMALALDGHFVVEQSARSWAGWFLNFNGTAGVLRACAITDAGGWQSDTLTEDLDLSYRMQLEGWRVLYRRDVACQSEIPPDIHGLKTQQFRWTKGVQETARKILPRLWRSTQPFAIKSEGTLHLLSGMSYLMITTIALLSPFVVMAAATRHVHVFQPSVWLSWMSIAGSCCCYYTAARDLGGPWRLRMLRIPLFLVLSIGMSAHNTWAALEGMLGKQTPFERTPKYRATNHGVEGSINHYRSRASWSMAAELFLAGVAIVSVIVSLHFRQYGAVPFQMLFVLGYLLVAVYSLRHLRPAPSRECRPQEARKWVVASGELVAGDS